MNITVEAGSNSQWWQHLPWDTIAWCALLFWFGTIYADLMSENSDIKAWIKDKFKNFEIVLFSPSSYEENSISPTFKIRFLRRIRSNIRINVDTLTLGYAYTRKFSAEIQAVKDLQKHEEFSFKLATIYRDAHKNSFWHIKNENDEDRSFEKHSQTIVTIIVGKQEHKLYIKHFNNGGGEQGICFLLDEDKKLWEKGNERKH